MRGLLVLGMIIGMSMGLVPGVSAEAMNVSDQKALQGEIQTVDVANNLVKVDAGVMEAAKDFQITPETLILKNGQEVNLGSLRKGDSVLISYEANGDQMIGKRIILQES